ncbi:response regulator [Planosporangium flavigriseum]|uniref:Response regulatory domain-containing protein n=1 Tax=Planosporangium flavigriseum TaxID=373681 RepID=A0A8J3LYZ9_9ACTN|nr:response regulator transcription factor [Planosporangium flavigriseum]NJC65867.1 response regulator [Planosporangium flavigriseum]GIG76086.1 hypothetical protein Pfl04_44900 [Planosporangium flavigriseum]
MARILVVDDDPAVRQLLADVLGMNGHEVRTAAEGLAAVDAVKDFSPNCIVLDVMMPGMDGYGVLKNVRSQHGDPVPVIMLTAAADPDSAARAWADGVDYFLAKPFSADQLLELVGGMFGSVR